MEPLARRYSDAPSGKRGGDLGIWETGTLVLEVERAVAAVAPGQTAPLAESEWGFHVLRRDPVVEVRLQYIQVLWDGSHGAQRARTKDEASFLANQAIIAIREGELTEAVAARLSDAEDADLGRIGAHQLQPQLEEIGLALQPGEVSEIIDTPSGLWVLVRPSDPTTRQR